MIKRINTIILFFFCAVDVFAQGGVSAKASVNKSRILIGEPIELTVETYLPSKWATKIPLADTIPHFEFLDNPVTDSSDKNGSLVIKTVYRLTSFDSGHWVIPSFVLAGKLKTDTIGIDVVFSDFNREQDYHDIKDIIEAEPPEKKNQWLWFVLGGTMLLATVLYYLLRRNKNEIIAPVPEKIVGAFEEAMQNMELLSRDKLSGKLFFTRLTDIFRYYVFRKTGIHSLQRTTDDLVIQIRDIGLGKEKFDNLSVSLRLADFVKFAKYAASDEDMRNAFANVISAIRAIEELDNINMEKEKAPDA